MVRGRQINLGQFVTGGGKVGSIFSTAYAEVRLPLKPSDLDLYSAAGSRA